MDKASALIEEAFEFLSDVDPFAPVIESAEETIEADMSRVSNAASRAAMAMAYQLSAIDDTLLDAHSYPHVFIGPHGDPRAEQLEFARRAVISELAVNLGISEPTVAGYANTAHTLRTRLPRVWARLELGQTSYQKARIVADCADSLPDDSVTLAAFDEAMATACTALTPAKLRSKGSAMREKLHPEHPAQRHKNAMEDRRIWFDPTADGMTWFGALIATDTASRAEARIEANARDIAAEPGETRTLAQLRADVCADLLTGDGTDHEVKATVSVTVPVMTLLNEDTPEDYRSNPAVLNGRGPIDPETARRLCTKAPSLFRLLTDPIDGAILTVDRKNYRPHADLKRLLRALMPICCFPGCNRLAEGCDIDHSLDWILDGHTKLHNLAPLCRHHHRVKHNTLWIMTRAPETGEITWTSPTGTVRGADPPSY